MGQTSPIILVGWGTRIPKDTPKPCQGADLTIFFPANDGFALLPWTTFGDHAIAMSQDIPSRRRPGSTSGFSSHPCSAGYADLLGFGLPSHQVRRFSFGRRLCGLSKLESASDNNEDGGQEHGLRGNPEENGNLH
jgi:hypothetical protein